MKTTKLYFAAILSLVCCGGFVSQSAAADSSFYAKAKEEGRVVLYTSLAAEDNKPFRNAFENANPGVKLEIYRASGTTVLQKILTENRAGANLVEERQRDPPLRRRRPLDLRRSREVRKPLRQIDGVIHHRLPRHLADHGLSEVRDFAAQEGLRWRGYIGHSG